MFCFSGQQLGRRGFFGPANKPLIKRSSKTVFPSKKDEYIFLKLVKHGFLTIYIRFRLFVLPHNSWPQVNPMLGRVRETELS